MAFLSRRSESVPENPTGVVNNATVGEVVAPIDTLPGIQTPEPERALVEPPATGSITLDTEGPVAELVTEVLERSVQARASDIHVEPGENRLIVRIRVDGVLEELMNLPASQAAPFVSRLKVLARINIVERRRPQDGQFTVQINNRPIDVRLATVATLYGEKAVMRLLDTNRTLTTLQGLGMSEHHYNLFQKMVTSQHGLVIAAGPTGSGKTTTLHSALQEIDFSNLNVSTIEDPVEYIVPGINHIPVAEEIGVGFATQLRALLRQDPDVILVGETRDSDTARISVQAALSGRLVMTSLHATDALSTIYRLFQMEIEPYLVAASLRGVVSQRLIRKNCDACSEEYYANEFEKMQLFGQMNFNLVTLRRGVGCQACRGTGYKDRLGIYQILDITEEMREVISTRPDPSALAAAARLQGFKSLEEEAYAQVIAGNTTIEEVRRLVVADGK
ncbi:MAG: GspE/PulE family protein [Micrococcales bacterium]